MLIQIYSLILKVKALLSFPLLCILNFLCFLMIVQVNTWEGKGEVSLRISVEIILISFESLTQLFLLDFIYILALASVTGNFNSLRHLYSLLQRPSTTHISDLVLIYSEHVLGNFLVTFTHLLVKVKIPGVSVWISFVDFFTFFFLVRMRLLLFVSGHCRCLLM